MGKFTVQIIDRETEEVAKAFEPRSVWRQAERLENGVSINLNHTKFYTRILIEDAPREEGP